MRYHNITHDDMLNGDGLRVVLWVSGCNHHCKGCQNPETWNPKVGLEFTEKEEKEIFDQLDQDYISGITLSGGDPLFPDNREPIKELCLKIKKKYPTKNIWLYTGYLYEDVKEFTDTFLGDGDVVVDGKYERELPKADWVGSNNQRVIRLKLCK